MGRFYSKPRYHETKAQNGSGVNIIFSDITGIPRARELIQQPEAGGKVYLVGTEGQAAVDTKIADIIAEDSLEPVARNIFSNFPVNSAITLTGKESFIWRVQYCLLQIGFHAEQIQTVKCGPLTRDVFCVHCRTINGSVTHNLVSCEGCGRKLFVYDHFSRRLGSYMGFQVNAEAVDDIPELEALSS
ncbi:MAG: dimethylamine monooxygenase subunit DmmA family protein [Thiotrichales bacterium]